MPRWTEDQFEQALTKVEGGSPVREAAQGAGVRPEALQRYLNIVRGVNDPPSPGRPRKAAARVGYVRRSPAARWRQRVLEKIDRSGGDIACWPWLGAVNWKGYGKCQDGRSTRQAHCVVYELFVGPIPEGKQLDHLCRVRHCVNPKHLEPVTCQINIRRGKGFGKRTHCKRGHEYSLTVGGRRVCRVCKPLAPKGSAATRHAL